MKKNKWLVLCGYVLKQLTLGSVYIFSIFGSNLIHNFSWTEKMVSNIFSTTLLVSGLSTLFLTKYIGKFSPKFFTFIEAILFSTGFILSGLSLKINSYILFTISFSFSIGLVLSFITISTSKVMEWFPKNKAMAMSFCCMFFGIGTSIFSILSFNLILKFNISNAMVILGIIHFIILTTASLLIEKPTTENIYTNKIENNIKKLTSVLNNSIVYIIWVILFFYFMVYLSITPNLSILSQVKIGLSEAQAAKSIVSLYGVFIAIGAIVFGFLSDRFKKINILFIFSLIISMAVLFLLSGIKTLVLFQMAIFSIAACGSGLFGVIPAFVSEIYDDSIFFKAQSYIMSSNFIAGFIAPIIFAQTINNNVLYKSVLAFYFALGIISFIGIGIIKNRLKNIND